MNTNIQRAILATFLWSNDLDMDTKDEALGALQYCKMSNTVLSFNIQEWDTETQEVENIVFKNNPNEELLYDV